MFNFDLNRRNKAILKKNRKKWWANAHEKSLKTFFFYFSFLKYHFDSKFYADFNGVVGFLQKYVF